VILLVGAGGQLGRELSGCLGVLGPLERWTSREVDLADPGLAGVISRMEFPGLRAVVNAAAYTAVDRAESEEGRAYRVNAEAPRLLSALAARHGAPFVHYSTDYVYDGAKDGPYVEGDGTAPLNAYGRTKLAGDRLAAEANPRHLIFRTSWVYSQTGACFPRTVYGLARSRESLDMDRTQRGAPTSTELLAAATLAVLRGVLAGGNAPWGLYHLTAAGEATWLDFARLVTSRALELGLPLRLRPEAIRPRDEPDPARPARRPLNSILSTARIREAFGITLPDWRYHAERFAEGLGIQAGLGIRPGQP
jgi:dTDP-4-dehydrorhamnose reductase